MEDPSFLDVFPIFSHETTISIGFPVDFQTAGANFDTPKKQFRTGARRLKNQLASADSGARGGGVKHLVLAPKI